MVAGWNYLIRKVQTVLPDFSCGICGGTSCLIVSERDAKSAERLLVCLCSNCGLVQQASQPTGPELRAYYSHHYRSDYKGTYTPKPKYVYRAGRAARKRLTFIQRYTASAGLRDDGTSLIDIGAGGGEFVYAARAAGFHACGLEPSEGYSAFAREAYDIRVDTGELSDLGDCCFAIVTMFHVLEHMPEPISVFRKLHRITCPGGLLVVEVPNIEQADASPHNVFFKAHLYYYSASTLISAASEAFEPMLVDDTGNLRVIFKRRSSLVQAQTPSTLAVDGVRKRLSQKGWTEYLLRGGGWKRPFQRVVSRFYEVVNSSDRPLITLKRALKAP